MIHEVEIEEQKFSITDNPLDGRVSEIQDMDGIEIAKIIKGTKFDSSANLDKFNDMIMKAIEKDSDKLGLFISYQSQSLKLKTIMLCTGLGREDISKLPYRITKQLFEKCKEVLGGTAVDFLK